MIVLVLEAVDPEERNLRLALLRGRARSTGISLRLLRNKDIPPHKKDIIRKRYISQLMRAQAIARAYRVGASEWSKGNNKIIAKTHRTTVMGLKKKRNSSL